MVSMAIAQADDYGGKEWIWFLSGMGCLRGSYPSAYHGDDDAWKATCKIYYRHLRCFEHGVLLKLFAGAATQFPDKIPTSGQLYNYAKSIKKRLASLESAKRLLERPDPTNASAEPLWAPETLPEVDPANAMDFEQLARKWEQEDSGMPDRFTPAHKGKQRWAEFWAAWGKANG